jgi:hypothetical protein
MLMSLFSRAKSKWKQSGILGVAASLFRYAASRLDRRASTTEGDATSEFLTWVQFAVPGMLTPGNVEAFRHAIANMPPQGAVIEIGSFCGLSTTVISYWLDKYSRGNKVFTCDKWEFEGQQLGAPLGDSPSVTHDHYQAYVKETYVRVMRTFAADRLPNTIECFSDEFFQLWGSQKTAIDVFGRSVTLGGGVSFCYIDGNHTYDFARRDFENTDRALLRGGFILFDDSADGSHWEVNRLVREIAAAGNYELILTNPNYLFRKK